MPHFGILNVNKPSGCSSRAAVDRVERIVRPAKVGHAGTLDPLATGVLVICVGQATRLISYVQQMPKKYSATFLLGQRSDTDDIEGKSVEVPGSHTPTREEIAAALPQFLGEIEQVPPAHSAVKVAGRRAYKLARAGKKVNLAPRLVTIHRLSVRRYDYPQLELEIECGSGTYVRALGRDLANALGTSAVMSALERTAIGEFHIDDALSLEEVTTEAVMRHLQSPLVAIASMPRVTLSAAEQIEVGHGRPIEVPAEHGNRPSSDSSIEWAAVDGAGRLAAILRLKRGALWPAHNFTP